MIDSITEKSGNYKGFDYEVRAVNTGWRCGYVDLPDRLKGYFSRGSEVHDLEVHGGITFTRDDRIGFDCGHITDEYDQSIMSDEYKKFNISSPRPAWPDQTVKDLAFVERECKKLILQLIKIKTPYEKGYEAGKKAALEWRDVLGYEGKYQVSNSGLIRNDQECMVGQWKTAFGYICVRLTKKSGEREVATVHRLVGQAFISNSLGKPNINHIDCNPSNNEVSNLEWCTQAENIDHSRRLFRYTNLYWKRNRSSQAKLTEKQAQEIRDRKNNKECTLKLAKEYGVSKSSINRIANNTYYKPLPQAPEVDRE